MSAWVRSNSGTYYRPVKRARKQRRCEDCRRVLEVGAPYVEHRATMWAEFVADAGGGAYSITTCGIKTSDCPEVER